MAFLKRELAATQARICQLDALNDDKDKRIKVLLDRIKFLEERDNKSTYDKYFPENYNDERPGTSARASYTHHEPLNNHTQSSCWPSVLSIDLHVLALLEFLLSNLTSIHLRK